MVQRELRFKAGADYSTAINYALVYEDEVALLSLSGSASHVGARIDEHLWLLCRLEAINDEHFFFYESQVRDLSLAARSSHFQP